MFFFRRSSNHMALIAILVADALSKTYPIFTKLLYAEGWTPLSAYFLTLVFIVILLALHEFMDEEGKHRWELDRGDILGIVLTTFTGGIASPLLLMYGLQYVQASEAVIMNSTVPFFIVLFSVLLLGERFTKQTVFGGFFLIAGTGVVLWKELFHAEFNIGALVILVGALLGALTTIFHKKYVTHRHLDSLVLIRSLVSVGIVMAVMFVVEPGSFAQLRNPPGVWTVLGLSAVAFIIPYFLYFRAVQYVKATDVGLVLTAGPVIGVLMAHVFLHEQIRPEHFVSILLIGVGIFLINVPLTKLRIIPSRLMEIGPLRR